MELNFDKFEILFHLAVIFNFVHTIEGFSDRIKLFSQLPIDKYLKGKMSDFSIALIAIESKKMKLGGKLPAEESYYAHRFTEYYNKLKAIITEKDFKYGKKFESAFMLGGLMSFFVLVKMAVLDSINEEHFFKSLFLMDCAIALLMLYILVSSFIKSWTRIAHAWILVIFIFFVGRICLFIL